MNKSEVIDRLDKLLSREFILPVLVGIVFSVALFALREPDGKPSIEFTDFAFWLCVVTGISTGSLTVQKVGTMLKRGGE